MYDTYTLILKGCDFLMKYALTESGFAASPPDLTTVNAATTATCLMALDKLRHSTEDEKDRIIQNLFDLQIQAPKGIAFSWCIYEGSSNWATSKTLQAILTTRPKLITDDRVQKAIAWLTDQMNPGSGFGYIKRCPSRPFYTYHALRAFLYAYQSESTPDSQKDDLRRLAEGVIDYLRESQVEADTGARAITDTGVWADKEGGPPCAVSTLFALSTLNDWGKPLGKAFISDRMRAGGIDFIKAGLSTDPETWPYFEEDVRGWRLAIYLPEVLPLLLKFLLPEDKLIVDLIDHVATSYKPYKETLGWTLRPGGAIFSWMTANSISALVSYSERLRLEKTFPPQRIPPRTVINTTKPERREEGGKMETAALMVLTEATKFLFSQLGRGIELWREKKGEQAKPQTIESSERHGIPIVKLDEMELTVDVELLRINQRHIRASLHILESKNEQLAVYREQLASPLLTPETRAFLEINIPKLEREIDAEGKRLEDLLAKVYGGKRSG